MRDSRPLPGGDDVSLPSLAEVEHSDWPSLQRMCETLGLNPRGRSAVVRMRVADYVRHRAHPPSWRPAREHQAALLTRLGHPDLAERVWESTIQLEAPAPWVGLGHAQLAGGFLAEAAKCFGRAAQMGGPSGELQRAGRTREAIGVLRETLETDPTRADALNNLGVAYLAMGRPKSAAVNLERAAKHRESPRILLNLGKVMEDAHEPAEAVRAYDQVLKLRAKDPEAVAGRKRLGVPSKSRRSPRKGTAKSPKKATRTVRRKTTPSTEAPPS